MNYSYFFDLDGTIINSKETEHICLIDMINFLNSNKSVASLSNYNNEIFSNSPFLKYMNTIGIGVNELFWIDYKPIGDVNEKFYQWVADFQKIILIFLIGKNIPKIDFFLGKIFKKIAINNLMVYKDISDFINLKSNKDLYIITNGDSYIQYQKIIYSGLLPFFKMIFISGDFDMAKPSSNFYKKILEITNTNPEFCYMVGDNYKNDIYPAKNLGFRTLHIQKNSDLQKIYSFE